MVQVARAIGVVERNPQQQLAGYQGQRTIAALPTVGTIELLLHRIARYFGERSDCVSSSLSNQTCRCNSSEFITQIDLHKHPYCASRDTSAAKADATRFTGIAALTGGRQQRQTAQCSPTFPWAECNLVETRRAARHFRDSQPISIGKSSD